MQSCGLANVGNTCGINALLQCLSHAPRLRAWFLSGAPSGRLATELGAIVSMMWAPKDTKAGVVPGRFLRVLMEVLHDWIRPGEQTDVSEVWMALATTIATECHVSGHVGSPIAALAPDEGAAAVAAWQGQNRGSEGPWTDLTHGMLARQTRCMTCKHMCTNFESFACTWLEIPEGAAAEPVAFVDLMAAFFRAETITDWTCDHCKEPRPAQRCVRFWRLPPVWLIALKRFDGTGRKQRRPVQISPEFRFWEGAEMFPQPMPAPPAPAPAPAPAPTPAPTFRLCAIANHHGNTSGGHYNATCRRDATWWTYDDMSVIPAPSMEREFRENSAAYLLVYERVDGI